MCIWLRRNVPAGQSRNTMREYSQRIQPKKRTNLSAMSKYLVSESLSCDRMSPPPSSDAEYHVDRLCLRMVVQQTWRFGWQHKNHKRGFFILWNSSTSPTAAACLWRMPYARICMHFYGYWNWIFEWLHRNFVPHHTPFHNRMTFFSIVFRTDTECNIFMSNWFH